MNGLAGKRILVVEDEALISMMLAELLTDCGCVVIGPAAMVAIAKELIATEPLDAALLDVDLAGESALGLADDLRQKGVPFAFCTGFSAEAISGHPEVPIITKPYTDGEVCEVAKRLCAGS